MPSVFRAVKVAAVFALASITVVHAYVIPGPARNVDYRRRDLNVRIIEETSAHTVRTSLAAGPATGSDVDGQDSEFLNKLDLFNKYVKQADTNGDNIRDYASRASSSKDDGSFQQQCASELSSYYSNLSGAQNILSDLGRDKGLANYDRDNELETTLKGLVNLNKDTLKAVTVIVKQIPGLGPVLGPIVADIKCLLDEVLDAVENLTDGLLNSLCPLLKGVIQDYSDSMCEGGSLEILGLCANLSDLSLGLLGGGGQKHGVSY